MKYIIVLSIALALSVGCQTASTNAVSSGNTSVAEIRDVSVTEAQTAVSKAYSQFVDVRTIEEYASGHAARAVNIPLDSLPARLETLEKNEPVYLICQTGSRSRKAADVLKAAGFKTIYNVTGGTTAWKDASLPMENDAPHKVKTEAK
jgi:rhodanese-related sulfurtransferase